MTVQSGGVQKYPLDIEFRGRTKMFDIDTIAQQKDYSGASKFTPNFVIF